MTTGDDGEGGDTGERPGSGCVPSKLRDPRKLRDGRPEDWCNQSRDGWTWSGFVERRTDVEVLDGGEVVLLD